MFHFIFDYNYGNLWQIFTTRIRNEYSTKRLQTVLLQPDYVSTLRGKTENDTKTADRLCNAFCWTDCSKLLDKVVQCSFFSVFVRTFL